VYFYATRDRHAWTRARLLNPYWSSRGLKNNQNDAYDAVAIRETVGWPTTRLLPNNNLWQQVARALHRFRFQLIKWRTALAKEICGLLAESGKHSHN
jgi:transposase